MNSINKIKAEELVALGNKVVAISEDVRNRQADRLSRVTIRRGKEKEDSPTTTPEEWPLLLAELRSFFWAIEKNLSSMNETLDLLEI